MLACIAAFFTEKGAKAAKLHMVKRTGAKCVHVSVRVTNLDEFAITKTSDYAWQRNCHEQSHFRRPIEFHGDAFALRT